MNLRIFSELLSTEAVKHCFIVVQTNSFAGSKDKLFKTNCTAYQDTLENTNLLYRKEAECQYT